MITIFQAISILVISVLNLRIASLLLIFYIPFSPRYMGIPIGDGALSMRRVVIPLLFIVFLLKLMTHENLKLYINTLRSSRGVLFILLILFIVKIYSTSASPVSSNYVYVFDDILLTVTIASISMMLFASEKDWITLSIVITATLFISELFVIVELFLQKPVLSGIFDITVSVKETISTGRIREDAYRVQALYDTTLTFAQFLCLSWPFSYYLLGQHTLKLRYKYIVVVSLAFTPIALYLTDSRAGLITFVFNCLFMIGIKYWYRINLQLKLIAIMISIPLLIGFLSQSVQIYSDPSKYFSSQTTADRSAIHRVNQLFSTFEIAVRRPIIGYGQQPNVPDALDGINNLDNYYFRILIENGLVGLFIYLLMLLFLYLLMLRAYKVNCENKFVLSLLTSFIAITLFGFFISNPFNNIYQFIILGVVLSINHQIIEDIKSQIRP